MQEWEKGTHYLYGASYYAKLGDNYFEAADATMHRLASILVRKFAPQSSLDIGCAHGLLVHWLRQMGVSAYGVDVSDYAFSTAPEHSRAYLTKLDIEIDRIQFNDETLDLVTALEVLEHLTNLEYALAEIKRVLKPGGLFYVTTPLPLTDSKLGQFLLGRGWRRLDSTHVNVHGRHYWKCKLEESGFSYETMLAETFRGTPTGFWITKHLQGIPGGNTLRAYLAGTYMFRRLLPENNNDNIYANE